LGIATTSSPLRADSVDTVVGLLAEIDAAPATGDFYNRLCEALCRLTTMERAGLYLYDPTLRLVRAVGCHGVDPALLAGVEGTLDETPIARRALGEDRVVEASERLEEELPPRYARFAGITTITCTPISAGGRWLGVIFADRGGGRFELTDDERQAMWSLGKLAALAASVEQATIQREAARGLSERIDLIRDIHEGVIQRLFGLVLVLGSDDELDPERRRVCHDELRDVLGELREALRRTRRPQQRTTTMSVRQVLDRIATIRDDLVVDWPEGVEIPPEIEATAGGAAGGDSQRRQARAGDRDRGPGCDRGRKPLTRGRQRRSRPRLAGNGPGSPAGDDGGGPAVRHRRVRPAAWRPLARPPRRAGGRWVMSRLSAKRGASGGEAAASDS
jgi:signal transduction histidine kinase